MRKDAGVQEMKKEGIVNEREPTASWILNKKWKTAMSKTFEVMAPLCFIYNLCFRNLAKERELGFRMDLRGKMDFVQVCLPYYVQKDGNSAYAAYGVFGLKNMEEVANVLEEVMKPDSHGQVFFFALQSALWYNAPGSKQKEVWDGNKEDSGKGESQSKEFQNIELRSEFEIKSYGLH